MQTVELRIGGMTCQGCVRGVKNAISGVQGVTGVEVDLANKSATIEFDETVVAVDVIMSAITEAGYEVL